MSRAARSRSASPAGRRHLAPSSRPAPGPARQRTASRRTPWQKVPRSRTRGKHDATPLSSPIPPLLSNSYGNYAGAIIVTPAAAHNRLAPVGRAPLREILLCLRIGGGIEAEDGPTLEHLFRDEILEHGHLHGFGR